MPRECPGCGAKTATQEARFCRRCGAPLNSVGAQGANTAVSPVAPTVPLSDEGRATNGLAVEESQRLSDHTSRIKRAEMEELLRRVAREHDGDGSAALHAAEAEEPAQADGASAPAATVAATMPPAAKDGDSSSTSKLPAPQASHVSRGLRLKRWQLPALLLICLALLGALLAFIIIRRSRASQAVGPTAPPSAEGTQPVAPAQESAPQIEPLTAGTPPLPASASSPAPSLRARETETTATQPGASTRDVHARAGASPAPTAPATEGQTPPQAPAISPAEHYQRGLQLWASDRRAALEEFRAAVPSVPDAYYYLGAEYYSEGRDVKSLSDGELRAALNYFTRVTSGPHSGQASRYVQALGKEYDRRKKQPRP